MLVNTDLCCFRRKGTVAIRAGAPASCSFSVLLFFCNYKQYFFEDNRDNRANLDEGKEFLKSAAKEHQEFKLTIK